MSDCILLAVLACCAFWDVREHRIPNQAAGWGAVLGLGCTCFFSGTEHLLPGTGHLLPGTGHLLPGTGHLIPETGHLGLGTGHLGLGLDGALILWTGAGFLGRMVLVWGLGFPFFALRMTGAGDIKVMGLIAAYMGMRDGTRAIAAGLCLGAVLALGKMLREGSICQRFLYLTAYIRRLIQSKEIEAYYCPERDGYKCVIPLGACFFAGTLISVLWKG